MLVRLECCTRILTKKLLTNRKTDCVGVVLLGGATENSLADGQYYENLAVSFDVVQPTLDMLGLIKNLKSIDSTFGDRTVLMFFFKI